MPRKPDICVTGMGCCSAAGLGVDAVWNSVLDDRVCCGRVPGALFPTELNFPVFGVDPEFPSRHVGKLFEKNFFSGDFKNTNRTLLLILTAVHEALQSAGIAREELASRRVGIALGTTVGCLFNDEDYFIRFRDGLEPETGPVYDFLATHLAFAVQQALGVRGPICVITNACASGTDAVGLASKWLENDLCDIAIAGGADELSRIAYHGFACLMLTSDQPCTPFDRNRKGLNLGEGAGILVLEKNVVARERLLGRVLGYGSAGDAHHPTAPHPRGRGLATAVTRALKDAWLQTKDIHFINSHGTGTKANDLAETTALSELDFSRTHCPVVSTKGITGHTLGAAGAIEAILTLLALRNGRTPGSTGCLEIDPALPFPILPQGETATLSGRIGISESLAFGGSNSALILEGCDP